MSLSRFQLGGIAANRHCSAAVASTAGLNANLSPFKFLRDASLDELVYLLLRYSDHPSFFLVPGATDLLPFHPIMTFYVVLTGGAGEKGATIR